MTWVCLSVSSFCLSLVLNKQTNINKYAYMYPPIPACSTQRPIPVELFSWFIRSSLLIFSKPEYAFQAWLEQFDQGWTYETLIVFWHDETTIESAMFGALLT